MPPIVATIIFAIGILGLFYLSRDGGPRMSKGLWIPAIWLFLICTRPVGVWLGMSARYTDASEAYLEGSPLDRAVFTFLLLAALPILAARMDRVGPTLRKNAPILLFFLFCAVSILWSDFPFTAFKRFTKAIGDLAIVLIILTEPDPLAALKRLLTRLGFLLFPLSILFIKYYPDLGRRYTNGWTIEPIGVATQKNGLGVICMVYGVAFLSYFAAAYRDRGKPDRPRRLLAYGTIIAMIVWLLHGCQSMTSIAGLAMASGVMLLASRPGFARRRAPVHVLVLAVLGISLFALLFDPGGAMVEALGRNSSVTGRKWIWAEALSVPNNRWVGTGFESFWLGDRLQALQDEMPNFPINTAHNGYVEVYLNLGWAGVSLIALIIATGYRRVIAFWRQHPEAGALLLGLLLTVLFEGFTEAAFRMMSMGWLTLLVVVTGSQVSSSGGPPHPAGTRQTEGVPQGEEQQPGYTAQTGIPTGRGAFAL